MPGLPVHRQLPEFTQTHVHWVGDAIQPSHPIDPFSRSFQKDSVVERPEHTEGQWGLQVEISQKSGDKDPGPHPSPPAMPLYTAPHPPNLVPI